MPRIPRVVAGGAPHHVTQRGNRRMQPLFSGGDYQLYLDLAAARYLETNPLCAGLAGRPEDRPWSSARAHPAGEDDIIASVQPLIQRVPYPWSQFLDLPVASAQLDKLRLHSRTGQPFGDRDFLQSLERKLHIPIIPKNPAPSLKQRTSNMPKNFTKNEVKNEYTKSSYHGCLLIPKDNTTAKITHVFMANLPRNFLFNMA